MALVLADRVVEQTTTQGTNNFELIGTSAGYQAFSVVGNGSTVYYTAEGVNDDGTLTGQWEVGQGVYNAGVLSRDTILSSSTGSKVSFSAGQKNVFIDLPSEKAVVLDDTDKVSGYNISGGTINGTSIGATTPSTGKFTTLSSNDQANIGGIVGNENVVIPIGVNSGVSALYLWGGAATGTAGGRVYSGGSGASSNLNFGAKASGQIRFYTNQSAYDQNWSNLQFSVSNTTSAVNYVQVTGGATGSNPAISSQGSDTNVSMSYISKGSGQHIFATNGTINNQQVRFLHTASAVNYLTLTGSATNQEPLLSVAGTDTNINFTLQSKGTGSIDLASGSTGVNVSNGTTVTAITRTAVGSGYTSIPSVAISAPNIAGGVQATANAQMYTYAATIANGGTGYTLNDVLTVVGGTVNGSAATYTVTGVTGGVVTAVTVLLASSYTVLPSSPATTTGGTGTGCTLNLLWSLHSAFTITNAGSGYTSQPTVTFSGGGGSGASAYATVGSASTIRSLGSTLSLNTPAGESVRILDAGTTAVNFVALAGTGTGASPYVRSAGSDTNIPFLVGSKGTSPIQIYTNSLAQEQLRVSHTASAVNYVQVTGNVTTGPVTISSQGSDTNVSMQLFAKGSGSFSFFSANGSNRQFRIDGTTASVNYLDAWGATASNSPSLRVAGSDTNIDLALTPKGTGNVRFGTYTATVSSITGYIEIKDSGGTVRRLAVVA